MPYTDRRGVLLSWLPALEQFTREPAPVEISFAVEPPYTPSTLQYTIYEILYTITVLSDVPDPVFAEYQETIDALAALRPHLGVRYDRGQISLVDKRLAGAKKRTHSRTSTTVSYKDKEEMMKPASARFITAENAFRQFVQNKQIVAGVLDEPNFALLCRLASERQLIVMGAPLSKVTIISQAQLRRERFDTDTIEALTQATIDAATGTPQHSTNAPMPHADSAPPSGNIAGEPRADSPLGETTDHSSMSPHREPPHRESNPFRLLDTDADAEEQALIRAARDNE